MRRGARGLGLEIRCGVHSGECERRGEDVGGLAVHIGARIGALAGAGEVLVSSTVKDLVARSGLAFQDRGSHALKGIPDEWRLLTPAGEDDRLETLPHPPETKQDPLIDAIARRPRLSRALARATRRR
jgi:class 3 adenylate cyclase